MFGRLMPKEEKFFDLFNQHAEYCVKGAKELLELMKDSNNIETRLHAIEGFEKQADKITYHTIGILHKTFITPLDREDIHRLITKMDDILDLMEDAAQTVSLYDIQFITPEAVRLGRTLSRVLQQTSGRRFPPAQHEQFQTGSGNLRGSRPA